MYCQQDHRGGFGSQCKVMWKGVQRKVHNKLEKASEDFHYEEYRKLQAEEDENKNGKYKYLFHSLLNDLSRTNQKPGTKSKSITFFQFITELNQNQNFSEVWNRTKTESKGIFQVGTKTITKSTGFSTLNYN